MKPEFSQEQTTFLEKEMQKNNMIINTETLSLEEGNIDDFTENMILEETTADLRTRKSYTALAKIQIPFTQEQYNS
ncbi:708_t:CDS:2 [Cetraspora pellucida]|uniref:708_t:CDS:1 n=1 Tax=Cetraspora pellucida TaxID=1433469 RepID=A0A9N9HW22_9GLOM|nr:708_t:CDS:2 [Cetraspora pellucida]